MFDSLEERMKQDEDRISTRKQRIMRYALYGLIAVLLFGGLIFAVYVMS
jgi:hypothetical protein